MQASMHQRWYIIRLLLLTLVIDVVLVTMSSESLQKSKMITYLVINFIVGSYVAS